jgi:F0F1-type ATP synthase delta subunit
MDMDKIQEMMKKSTEMMSDPSKMMEMMSNPSKMMEMMSDFMKNYVNPSVWQDFMKKYMEMFTGFMGQSTKK